LSLTPMRGKSILWDLSSVKQDLRDGEKVSFRLEFISKDIF
jgi:hypothetical protein